MNIEDLHLFFPFLFTCTFLIRLLVKIHTQNKNADLPSNHLFAYLVTYL
jgi:hypothetical protein